MRKAFFFLFVFLSYVPVLAQVDTAWVRRYDGPANFYDYASVLAVDDSGNVYVAGSSYDLSSNWDYLTIKYAPNGDTMWVRRYNGPGNGNDFLKSLTLDNNGNAYVTGSSYGNDSYTDYATIKYTNSGDTVWIRRFNEGNNAKPNALAVDDSGSVYVSGSAGTIKYLSNGDTAWLRPFYLYNLIVDSNGNLYGSNTGAAFKLNPHGDSLWVRSLITTTFISLAIDCSLNVYIAGFIISGGTLEDYITVKFAPNGDTLWTRLYNGPSNQVDMATAVIVDEMGNVHVTGYSWGAGPDYATIKYNSNGDTIWMRRHNGLENNFDLPSGLALDTGGNVYVTGRTDATFSTIGPLHGGDYTTIKYSSNGDILWIRKYNGPGDSTDVPVDLAVDDSGNVYVTGESSNDFATIKYVQFTCSAKPGDVNGDNKVLLQDIVAIINHLFKSQPAPNPLCRGDANADGSILLPDIVYLINSIFKSGPAPQKSRECCL